MGKKIKLLRLILNITPTSGVYHQSIIPSREYCDQTVISIFKPEMDLIKNVKFYYSDNSIIKYLFLINKVYKSTHFNAVHAHTPHVGLLFLLQYLFTKRIGIKKVFSVHYSFNFIRFRNKVFLLPIFIFFDKIIFCSESSKASFPKLFLYIIKNKSQCIYNGVDSNLINKPNSFIKPNHFKIITVSRLIKTKNIAMIIKALKLINNPKLKLTVIGDGSEKNHLIELTKLLDLEKNISFVGEISRKEVYKHLAESNLFISMSITEGFPVAVLEALASGTPVILSNIGPHTEILKSKDCIKLVDKNSPNDLKKEVLRFFEIGDKEAKEIHQKCKSIIDKYFSIKMMTNNYLNTYK